MKKLFALLTVLLFAGFAFSQDFSSIIQDGNTNMADVDQTYWIGAYNNSYITQDGEVQGSEAWIDQLGGGNLSNVQQTLLWGPYGSDNDNKAWVYQTGWDNNTQIYQVYDNEEMNVYQDGMRNYSVSSQIGNENKGFAVQLGNDNIAYLYQENSNNWANAVQVGFGNYSIINQIDGHQSMADVYSEGTSNFSSILQLDYRNFSDVDQVGLGNQSYITQQDGVGETWPYTKNNDAKVLQLGSWNVSNVFQNGISNSVNVYQH